MSSSSMTPTLGINATLPQHRLVSSPHQEQYPILYFFYGTLADPEQLCKVL
jgi:hypothetical protein